MIKILITLALCVVIFCLAYSRIFAHFKTKKYDEKTNLVNRSAVLNSKEDNFYAQNESAINAPAETVWNILFDAKKWHTFYKGVEKPVQITDSTHQTLGNDERIKMKEILTNSASKFNKSVVNLSEAQINFKPSSDKWSIAECIEHITLTEIEFPKILANEMQKPAHPELRNKIKIQDEAIQPKMTNRSWKAKSPEIFKPSNKNFRAKDAISLFNNQRNDTIAYVEVTKDDLRNHFWKHPLTGTIDLYQTLLLMSAHLERHTEQIEEIKLSPQFPDK